MIPNTNLHKIAGFLAGLAAGWLAKQGLEIDPEWIASIILGVSLVVGSIVAKWTNPTGANRSDVRQVLESQVKTATGEYPVNR
jgi:uncharacterized membrane protein YeaQ/YmgE (transglycosylase-associated protein family)